MISRVDRFNLPAELRTQILVHLLDCAPNEGVGMIGARRPRETDFGTIAQGVIFMPGRNVDRSPTHFTMDPEDVVHAFRVFREQGLELGAIVHSHIKSPPTPSETDVREWNYPEAIMMVASFASQPPELRAWRIVEDDRVSRVQPIKLEIG